MESCVNEGARDDRPPVNDPTPPVNDPTPPVNDPTPPVTGVDIPESCRKVGIGSETDPAYSALVAYN